MNPTEIGKLIASLRKEAGYTQASLAKELNITDKAVSKWERGYGQPDTSLLPQLAKLLDCDMEILISGLSEYKDHEWTGLLVLNDGETSAATEVYDKPLIHYLLSYFMLVGITTINIQANYKECEYIRSMNPEQYGLKISFNQCIKANTMVVYDKALIFGANLTRVFQSYMSADDVSIIPVAENIELPIAFSHYNIYLPEIIKTAQRRKMTRGMICLPLNTSEQIKDASEFVRIYQQNHNVKIADLKEIAVKRGIIS